MSFKPIKGYKCKDSTMGLVEDTCFYFNINNVNDVYKLSREDEYKIYFGAEDSIICYSPQLTKILETAEPEKL